MAFPLNEKPPCTICFPYVFLPNVGFTQSPEQPPPLVLVSLLLLLALPPNAKVENPGVVAVAILFAVSTVVVNAVHSSLNL